MNDEKPGKWDYVREAFEGIRGKYPTRTAADKSVYRMLIEMGNRNIAEAQMELARKREALESGDDDTFLNYRDGIHREAEVESRRIHSTSDRISERVRKVLE